MGFIEGFQGRWSSPSERVSLERLWEQPADSSKKSRIREAAARSLTEQTVVAGYRFPELESSVVTLGSPTGHWRRCREAPEMGGKDG